MSEAPGLPVHVTLIATPETQVAPLSGLYEALTAFPLLRSFESDLPEHPFEVQVAAPGPLDTVGADQFRFQASCACDDIVRTDVAIVPLMAVDGPDWVPGRHPQVVDWLRRQHAQGALLCSVCTGALLLGETGLLDGREATIHWAFAETFRRTYPEVSLRPEEVLITAGDQDDIVMTGGVMSWHDLALHLVTRFVGPSAARALARMLMLERHRAGQAPYIEFTPNLDHDDGLVSTSQAWLEDNLAVANPVEELCARSGVTRRTLERRFRTATGYSPIAYVQQLRIREARRLLERTTIPVEQVGFTVGYQNIAYFRRLFSRTTRLGPGAYRRKFGRPRIR